MILIQGKNKEYLSARKKVNEILRTASFHRGFKKVKTTSFKVTEFKNQQYSSEFDVEVKKGGEQGKAKITIYKDNKKKEGKKEQTIMITKKAKNESKFVKKVSKHVIESLLEGFIKKELKIEDIVNETKEESEAICDICEKKCINDQGLALHKSRMHDIKKKVMDLVYKCEECDGKFQMRKLLNEHIRKVHKKVEIEGEYDTMKRVLSTSPGEGKKRKKVEKEKTEVEKIYEEYVKYKKESEKKYNDLKEENRKMKEELEKLQTEKALKESKDEVDNKIKSSNKKRYEQTPTVKIDENVDIDECIDGLNSLNLSHMKAASTEITISLSFV